MIADHYLLGVQSLRELGGLGPLGCLAVRPQELLGCWAAKLLGCQAATLAGCENARPLGCEAARLLKCEMLLLTTIWLSCGFALLLLLSVGPQCWLLFAARLLRGCC
jgi:hypothetical protein